jgi:hypothetical protein
MCLGSLFEKTEDNFENSYYTPARETFNCSIRVALFISSCYRLVLITRLILEYDMNQLPITVAARSKAWTVFALSNTGIVGSSLTRGMDVCMR